MKFVESRITLQSLVACLLLPAAIHAADEIQAIPLWPGGPPGSENQSGEESVRTTSSGEHVVSNVHRPSITPFIPAADIATGAAVIIAPGGGHRELWMDHEGYNLARWLRDRGIAGFVLKYRLARGGNSPYSVDDHALADMRRAIRVVRNGASQWRIDPGRVGVMGFSAGGELAALAAMRFDSGNTQASDPVERQSSRPDFQALIYPGSSRRFEPAENSPPAFIVCGYKDRPDISRGMAEVYLKFKEAGVPAELHIFSEAGHGFGVRERNRGALGKWPLRFEEWLGDRGLLKNP